MFRKNQLLQNLLYCKNIYYFLNHSSQNVWDFKKYRLNFFWVFLRCALSRKNNSRIMGCSGQQYPYLMCHVGNHCLKIRRPLLGDTMGLSPLYRPCGGRHKIRSTGFLPSSPFLRNFNRTQHI